MSQEEVLKILEKENRWMNCKEISRRLDTSDRNTSECLRKLVNNKEIFKKRTHKIGDCGYKVVFNIYKSKNPKSIIVRNI